MMIKFDSGEYDHTESESINLANSRPSAKTFTWLALWNNSTNDIVPKFVRSTAVPIWESVSPYITMSLSIVYT